MKEYLCKRDYYIGNDKIAVKGDYVTLTDEGDVVNNRTGLTVNHRSDIVKDIIYFQLLHDHDVFVSPELKEVQKIMKEKEFDEVKNPKHYTQGDIQCIDAMIAAYGKEAVMYFCQCNAFKYQWRFKDKNGIQDIEKAQWYQNKYIELSNG